MSEWQPIETAPKDGTVILLSDGRWVYSGTWSTEVIGSKFPWVFFEGVVGHQPHGCCDREDGERVKVNGWLIDGPTHWMPLPEGPKND